MRKTSVIFLISVFMLIIGVGSGHALEIKTGKSLTLVGRVVERQVAGTTDAKALDSKESEPIERDPRLRESPMEKITTPDAKSEEGVTVQTVPLAGATVVIKNTPFIAKTDSMGQFNLPINLTALPSVYVEVVAVKQGYDIAVTKVNLTLMPKLEIVLKKVAWQEVKFGGAVIDESSRPLADVKLYFNHCYWSACIESDARGGFYTVMKLPQSDIVFDVRAEKYGYQTTSFQMSSQKPELKILLKRDKRAVTFHGRISQEVGETVLPLQNVTVYLQSTGSGTPVVTAQATTGENGEFSADMSVYTLNPIFNIKVQKTNYKAYSTTLNLLENHALDVTLPREMYNVTLSGITYEKAYPGNTNKVMGNVALEIKGDGFTYTTTSAADGTYSIAIRVPKVNPQVRISGLKRFYTTSEKTITGLTSSRAENIILTPRLKSAQINLTVQYKNPLSSSPYTPINLGGASVEVSVGADADSAAGLTPLNFMSDSYGRVKIDYTFPEAARYVYVRITKPGFRELALRYKIGQSIKQETVFITPKVINKTIFGKVSIYDAATQIRMDRKNIPVKMQVPGKQDVYTTSTDGGDYEFTFSYLEISPPAVTVSLHLFGILAAGVEARSVSINAAAHVGTSPVNIETTTINGTVRISGSLTRGDFYDTTLKIKWYEIVDGFFITHKTFNLGKSDIDSFTAEISMWQVLNTVTLVFSRSGYYDRIIRLENLQFGNGTLIEIPVQGVSLSEVPLTKTVTGIVKDGNNNPLAGVSITNGSTTVTSLANGSFSIPCTAGDAHPRVRITGTKTDYTMASQWVDLKTVSSVQLIMPMLSHTITVKGRVDLPLTERVDVTDYASFNITLSAENESYTATTDGNGNFSIAFTHYPVSAKSYTLTAQKADYTSSSTTIDVSSYDINKDAVVEKVLTPLLQKTTRSITINVFGYKNAALDGVSYNVSALAGSQFLSERGGFNKSVTHTVTLPDTNPRLLLTLNANMYNEFETTVDISQTETVVVNLIPEMHAVTVSGKAMIGGELILKEEQLMLRVDGEFAQYITTNISGYYETTLDVPKVAQQLIVSHPGGEYHVSAEKVVDLYHYADRYEQRNLNCNWIMVTAAVDVKLFRHVYRSFNGAQTGDDEALEEGTFEIVGRDLYLVFNIANSSNHIILDEISVPAYCPKVVFTLSAPQCVIETQTFDVSKYNSINHTMHTVYNPDQIVTYYSGKDYTQSGALLTQALIGDGWWDIPGNESGYIKVGVAAAAAGAANVFGYRKFTHWCQKDCKAKIFMKVKWRYGGAQYTIGTAAETFDIVLNINGNHMGSLADAGFSLFIPSPSAGWKDVAEAGVDALLTYLQVTCSQPEEYAELLLMYDYNVSRGQFINLHPGFQIKVTAVIGGSGAIIEGYIEGILIVEGDTTLNEVIYEWLSKGGDYELYTQYHPYMVVCEGIADFAFDQAMGELMGGDGD
ncbi:MAG: carboxypeptidase regulatory-like domain-containing protein [Spirochaetales bacterium]|nr:carboxypeptidase regulatory-like domain-containing protein [Spirochaetales bacterium]